METRHLVTLLQAEAPVSLAGVQRFVEALLELASSLRDEEECESEEAAREAPGRGAVVSPGLAAALVVLLDRVA